MRLLVCALASLLLIAATSPDALVGRWVAKRRFGPDARGTLVVQRNGDSWTAELVGKRVPIRVTNDKVEFELPAGAGAFRGRIVSRDAIDGFWFPPKTATTRTVYASPVHLRSFAPNDWRGEVDPIDETFTMYLSLEKTPDGSLRALLRNPDRDIGTQLGVNMLTISGDAVKLLGKRGEVASGAYDADSDTLTLALPARGGTYDFHRDVEDSDMNARGKGVRYTYRRPVARDDGWSTASVDEVDIDRPAIERLVQSIIDTPIDKPDSAEVHALLIARHGKLVVEEYFHGEHRDRLHETRSAAKSLTATIVGAAMHAGMPVTLSTPVYKVMNGGAFPADLEPRKRAMTLEHLLTMSSGYFCDDTDPDAPGNEETMFDQEKEPDYYRYTLAVPMAFDPGEHSIYCSINPNLALGVVARAAGESPLTLFDRLVAQPMKFRRWAWPLDPAGNPYGGGGVQLLPRDFMKLGQLMLDGGTFGGRRILDREFVARASSPLYHLRNVTYGYLWWGIDFPYNDRTLHAFYAGGAGGQGVIVVPALDLVVETLAGNYSSRVALDVQQNITPRFILPAVRESGDDEHAPIVPRDCTTPYGRSAENGRVRSNQR